MRCARKKRKAPRLAGLKEKKLSAALLMCFSSASTKCSSRRSRATPARPRNVAVEPNRYARAHMPSAVWANQRDRRCVCNEPNRSTAQRSGCSRRRRSTATPQKHSATRSTLTRMRRRNPHTHAPPWRCTAPGARLRRRGRCAPRVAAASARGSAPDSHTSVSDVSSWTSCSSALNVCARADESVPARNAWPCTGRHLRMPTHPLCAFGSLSLGARARDCAHPPTTHLRRLAERRAQPVLHAVARRLGLQFGPTLS